MLRLQLCLSVLTSFIKLMIKQNSLGAWDPQIISFVCLLNKELWNEREEVWICKLYIAYQFTSIIRWSIIVQECPLRKKKLNSTITYISIDIYWDLFLCNTSIQDKYFITKCSTLANCTIIVNKYVIMVF